MVSYLADVCLCIFTHTQYASKYAHTHTHTHTQIVCTTTHAMFSCSACTCILIASSILDDVDIESRAHCIIMDMLDGEEPHLGESMESLGSEQ